MELSPIATQLVDDPVPNVRKLLTELCVDVAAKVGPEVVGSTISDLVVKLMDDDDPLVRLRVIRKIPVIAEEAPSLCTRLTEHFKVPNGCFAFLFYFLKGTFDLQVFRRRIFSGDDVHSVSLPLKLNLTTYSVHRLCTVVLTGE